MARQVKYDFNPFKITGTDPIGIKQKTSVLKEIADFIVKGVRIKTKTGNSPVSGLGKYKKLNKEYAAAQKGGNRTPNLRLKGDLMEGLKSFTLKGNIMRLTVDQSDNSKADGHNNHSGNSSLPPRRFIPKAKDGQTFKKNIIDGIRRIIKDSK